VECVEWLGDFYKTGRKYPVVSGFGVTSTSIGTKDNSGLWRIVSRAPQPETPKLWRDMTPEEKGALFLAHHEGEVIEVWLGEWYFTRRPYWKDVDAYRIRPEPKRETVTLFACRIETGDFHKVGEVEYINGKPDFTTIKPLD
jgi:hypothetical protein